MRRLARFVFLTGLALWAGLRLIPGTERRFVVSRGASAHAIALQLKQEHFIWHPWTFLIWSKIDRSLGVLHPGHYKLSSRWTGFTIYRKIRQGPPLVRITFPEGWTSQQMAELLGSRGVTSAAGFLTVVQKGQLEGYLFPDTYFLEQGLAPQEVVGRLLRRFPQKKPQDMALQMKRLRMTERQIVIMASLVEKEARAPQERGVVAGVFYNRLRKHWRLESCATVQYALGAWKPQLTYKDLEIRSPYNTYRHYGLPPGPICNPGAAALEAAVHPAVTDMMFFVADGQGTHRFSRYYREHLAAQRENP